MSRLELTFFGSPHISLDGAPRFNRLDKTVALMAMLALHSSALQRDLLITTLWTNSNLSKAQSALRTALWRLKDAGLSPWLEIQRDLITLKQAENTWIDVVEFRANLEKASQPPHDQSTACPECSPWLEAAVNLYRGDLMAGYSPRNASGFDEWRTQVSQRLRDDCIHALERLVRGYYKQGLYPNAIQFARRWLAMDPFNDEAHTLIMRSYANNNQRAHALTHYRAYKRQVEKILEISPSKEIVALYNHLLGGRKLVAAAFTPLEEPAFLMVDIHHLPDLWVRHGAIMDSQVDRFTKVVNEGLRICGGRLLKHTADSYLLYFDQGQPVLCAIVIHRLISQTKWDLPDPLPIRMAITTIANHRSGNPEYSPELASCQALLYAASENQILLTEQATRGLEFPISSRPNNLGSYLLPGQHTPIQIYELIHPQLPRSESHGLHSLVRSPANLPIQVTHFVGRDGELEQLYHLLAQPERHLLTLVGPGGVGKTRLAIQVISQMEHSGWDGICYVPLAGHINPKTIYRPIAEALNLPLNKPEDQATQLIHYLRSKRMVLLLDNFEHLLDATPIIVEMLEGSPGLRIIITSRERLNLRMETPFEVQGLPYPEEKDAPGFDQYSGIKLFIQNAQRVFPGFILRPEDKASIIQICRQVDGLPLGIELASTWVRVLTCQEIAAAIQHNIEFPQSTSQDVPLRHRSLRAAFEHSWSLLSEEDRRILGRLSVFNNGFFPAAAEQIANATPAMLAGYIDKSMLARQPNGRFIMLEVLRVYALEHFRANALESEQILDRYCEYYLQHLTNSFSAFSGKDAAAEIRKLWLDANNVRSALNWAMDHHQWSLFLSAIDPLMLVFELQGRFKEGYDNTILLIKRITDLVGIQQPGIYYSLIGWQGVFGFRLGYTQEGLSQMQARLDHMQSQDDQIPNANFYALIADAHRRLGQTDLALAEISQSLEILDPQKHNNDLVLACFYANALVILGRLQLKLNQLEAARQTAYRCGVALSLSNSQYVSMQLLDLQARIANEDKRYQESIDLRFEALAIAEEFDDRRTTSILLNNMGDSAERMGDYPNAIDYLTRALQLSEEGGDKQVAALCNNNLGFVHTRVRDTRKAIQYYHQSLRLYQDINNQVGYFLTLRDVTRAYIQAGEVEEARRRLLEAFHLGIELNEPLRVLQVLPATARLFHKIHMPDRAEQLCVFVLNHPRADEDLRRAAKSLLVDLGVEAGHTAGEGLAPQDLTLPTFQSLVDLIEGLPLQTQNPQFIPA